jgi:membrane-associated phospholipid phosphatase
MPLASARTQMAFFRRFLLVPAEGRADTLTQRVSALPGHKVVLAIVLTLWLAVPYFTLQRYVVFPVTAMPPSALDRLIPFAEVAAWPYLSLFLALPIPPLLFSNTHDLRRYGGGMALIGLISDFCFFFGPTSTSRPVTETLQAAYSLVLATDAPLNACPSLHASLAVFTALCNARLVRPFAHCRRWRLLGWSWAGLIVVATLAARQHVLIDLIAGTLLAVAVDTVVWRKKTSDD